MTSRRRVVLLMIVALLLACESATGPVAGTLKVNLVDPHNGQDGAVMLVLSSPYPPVSVTAGPGLTLWGGPVTTPHAWLVLTGVVTSGTILSVQVEDTRKLAQYGVTLQQVANANDFTLQSLGSYSVTITK